MEEKFKPQEFSGFLGNVVNGPITFWTLGQIEKIQQPSPFSPHWVITLWGGEEIRCHNLLSIWSSVDKKLHAEKQIPL